MAEEDKNKESEKQKTIDDLAREIKEEDGPQKSIDELAREAMAAIKASEKKNEWEEREQMKLKEEKLKQEAKNRIKSKLRRLEQEQQEEERKEQINESIESQFMVTWENPDEKGIKYEGVYNDKTIFKINRGITLFHLYIVDNDVIVDDWKRNSHTSVNLYTLKEKADKILKESNKKLEEIKEKTKGMVQLAKKNYKSKDGTIKEGVNIEGKFYAPEDDL